MEWLVRVGSTPTYSWPARPLSRKVYSTDTVSRPRRRQSPPPTCCRPTATTVTPPSLPPFLPSSLRHQPPPPGLSRAREKSSSSLSIRSSPSARALTSLCRPAAAPAGASRRLDLIAQLPRLRRFSPRANHASHLHTRTHALTHSRCRLQDRPERADHELVKLRWPAAHKEDCNPSNLLLPPFRTKHYVRYVDVAHPLLLCLSIWTVSSPIDTLHCLVVGLAEPASYSTF